MIQSTQFAAVDQHTIAAQFSIAGQQRLVRGRGRYEANSDLGSVLRIHVDDPAGDFELLLLESQWAGQFEDGAALGCDFLVDLATAAA